MEQLSFAATTAGVYVSVDSGLTFSQNKQVFFMDVNLNQEVHQLSMLLTIKVFFL
jgi:hypothetical protein